MNFKRRSQTKVIPSEDGNITVINLSQIEPTNGTENSFLVPSTIKAGDNPKQIFPQFKNSNENFLDDIDSIISKLQMNFIPVEHYVS